MSTQNKLPVNLELLHIQERDLIKLGRITDPQIFDNNNNFHPEGLFSTTIFGAVGSEYRNRVFGYIDLNAVVLHPLVYISICELKSLYKQIMDGTTLAIFDSKTKDFVKSNDPKANTGYSFFLKHIEELKFESGESDKRTNAIKVVMDAIKAKKHLLRYVMVMPAGLRDYIVDPSGKPQEDEINTFYRRLLSLSNIVDSNVAKKTPDVYDNLYVTMQNNLVDLFNYLKSLLEGKNKLVLGKWLSRKVFNSTRNVLSGSVDNTRRLTDKNRLSYNECLIGIHQFARGVVPKSTYEIRNKYIRDVFIENNNMAYLTNVKTLKREEVLNTHIQKEHDMWTSSDGIEKVIASLGNLDMRHNPVTFNKGKHYLGLLYRDSKYFKFLQDIDDLPEGYDKSKVEPVSLAEIVYMSLFHLNGEIPGLITRYPVQGYGGIYPAFIKFTTTFKVEMLEELDNNWQPTGNVATNFPIRGLDFFNTTSVHPSHLGRLGADFDGDTISVTPILADDVKEEIKGLFNKRSYYISDSNDMHFNMNVDVIESVLTYMTN